MRIEYKPSGNFEPCPEYNGIAKIVDTTELTEYTGQFGTKEQFRFILEINQQKTPGVYWTVATKPLTPSYHEKANLRAFTESVLGRPMTKTELLEDGGFDTENLMGRYCHVFVEHVQSKDGQRTFANIKFVTKAKENTTWTSNYVRLEDRESKVAKKIDKVVDSRTPAQQKADAEEAKQYENYF